MGNMSLTPLEVPGYLSPSSIDTFQICPLKYKFSRIDHMSEPPTEHTILGNYVHDVFEELLKLPPEQRTLVSAKVLLATLWNVIARDDESWGTKIERILESEEDLRKFRWRAWWCVENYFQMENPAEVVYGGLETSLELEIEGVPIKGFIDRWEPIDDGFGITDYKTGKSARPKYQAKKFQQLLIYATGLGDVLQLEPKEMTLLYVKDKTVLTQQVTPVAVRKTRELIRNTYDQIIERCEKGEFEATKNPLCGWCAYKPICPAWRS